MHRRFLGHDKIEQYMQILESLQARRGLNFGMNSQFIVGDKTITINFVRGTASMDERHYDSLEEAFEVLMRHRKPLL